MTLGDLTKDDVLAVEPRGDDGGDKELRTVGVGSSVGHGQEEWAVVKKFEVFVGKLVAAENGLMNQDQDMHRVVPLSMTYLAAGTVVSSELFKLVDMSQTCGILPTSPP